MAAGPAPALIENMPPLSEKMLRKQANVLILLNMAWILGCTAMTVNKFLPTRYPVSFSIFLVILPALLCVSVGVQLGISIAEASLPDSPLLRQSHDKPVHSYGSVSRGPELL